jgi:hypothetical protein
MPSVIVTDATVSDDLVNRMFYKDIANSKAFLVKKSWSYSRLITDSDAAFLYQALGLLDSTDPFAGQEVRQDTSQIILDPPYTVFLRLLHGVSIMRAVLSQQTLESSTRQTYYAIAASIHLVCSDMMQRLYTNYYQIVGFNAKGRSVSLLPVTGPAATIASCESNKAHLRSGSNLSSMCYKSVHNTSFPGSTPLVTMNTEESLTFDLQCGNNVLRVPNVVFPVSFKLDSAFFMTGYSKLATYFFLLQMHHSKLVDDLLVNDGPINVKQNIAGFKDNLFATYYAAVEPLFIFPDPPNAAYDGTFTTLIYTVRSHYNYCESPTLTVSDPAAVNCDCSRLPPSTATKKLFLSVSTGDSISTNELYVPDNPFTIGSLYFFLIGNLHVT